MGGELSQVAICPQQKHAAVPEISARVDILLRGLLVRFLYKLSQLKQSLLPFGTTSDVTIACLGVRRHNAKCHQRPGHRPLRRLLDSALKRVRIRYMMISRQNQEQCLWVNLSAVDRGQCNRRRRVAACRLENDRGSLLRFVLQLLSH